MERRLIERWLFWDDCCNQFIDHYNYWDDSLATIPEWIKIVEFKTNYYDRLIGFCEKRRDIAEQNMAKALCGK